MQTSSFDPVLSVLAFIGFLIVFLAYGYSKGLLWFQQDSTKRAESWLTSFNARDAASGGWFRRFGRPILVLFFIHVISYPVVTNLFTLSPFQFVIFVFVYYIPSGIILTTIMFAIQWRVHKQPVPEKGSPDQTDEPVQ